MRVKGTRSALIVIVSLSLLTVSFAQSPPPQKEKKIEDFGSSLKRLKWNPEKNAAVEVASTAEELEAGDVIRIETSLVACDLLVLDNQGKNVSGLTATDFSITEDNQPQAVGHFLLGNNANVPRSIVLIIDYSGSQLAYLKNSIAAAKVLVDKLGPRDRMAIVTDDVELLVDFTDDKKKLKKELELLQKRTKWKKGFFRINEKFRVGRSKQYSALMATLNEAFDDEDIRPIIIFQTDGDEVVLLRDTTIRMTIPDGLEGESLLEALNQFNYYQNHFEKNSTEFSLDDLYRAVERSRATIYTVMPGPKLIGLQIEEQAQKMKADHQVANASDAYYRWRANHVFKMQSALAVVGTLTGGWTEFLEQPEQADAIYSRIFSDINQRYIVGYYPTNKERDGKRRKIQFEVKGHPEYQVFGRRSYFAPGP